MAPRARRILPPITGEEAAAKEAVYSDKHHEPVVLPTKKSYELARRLWEGFRKHCRDEGPCLQKHEEIPSAGRLKHFMEWVYDTSIGMLSEHVTFKSLKNTWYRFRTMYYRETDQAIPEETGTDVLRFIKTELKQRGLANIRRQKALADSLDVVWLLTYLWCYDKHEFRHPRTRAQLSLIALFIVYTGARGGSIVESSAYRGSNEAMCYKDFELIGLPIGPNNTLEFVLKVRFRYEKGNRDQGGSDDVEYKWVTFREDRVCRGRCPVTHFFGLAFADGAFAEVKGAHELKHLRGGDARHLRFKESKKDIPVFRHCNTDGTIDPHRAMNYDETAREVLEWGIRLGFRDPLRLYNLRRGTANEVEGNVEVSQNQYCQLLGHAIKVMGASYISSISGIDVQGIVNHETLRQDHIRLLRSMRLHLNPNAPSQLPFAECKAVLDHPDLVEHDNRLNLLEQERRTKGDSVELRQQHLEATWGRKHCFQRIYREARLQFRYKSFDVAESNTIRKMIEDGEKGVFTDEIDEKVEVPPLDFVSKVHFPDRFIIASGFWTKPPQDSLPDVSLIQSLQNMCRPGEYVQYYHGEAPVDGYCPVCEKQMAELPGSQRPSHIHNCFADMHKKKTEMDFSSSRPTCCKWGNCKSQFAAKRTYLPDDFAIDVLDVDKRRLLVAKESKRLHELRRKENLTKDKGVDQALQSRKSISNHLKRHISNQTLCLWNDCGCQCTSEQELKRHLWKSHVVTLKQAPFEPQFCFEHPDSGWFTDEFDWEDHFEIHLKTPRRRLNLTRSHHMITAGLQCPFCKRFTQFTDRGTFNRHMDSHEKAYRDQCPMNCPVASCNEGIFSYFDLQIHFFDSHDLKIKGWTRSHGLRREKDKSLCLTSKDEDDDKSLGDEMEELGLENVCEVDLEDETEWTDDDSRWDDSEEGSTALQDLSKRKMLVDKHVRKRQRL